jgi:tetratricopeptide (TPR) repeat protein
MIAPLKEFDLEKESLLASGVRDDEGLATSVQKLDDLHQQFITSTVLPPDSLAKAEALFKWLWTEKPARYQSHGSYKLHDVIDAQRSQDSQTVGNCLGLTVLYHCLLRRLGIVAEALYLENAFGMGPHVLTLLETGGCLIDIENILPDGFDYQGHLNDPSRTRWDDRELVADIYHSLGNECFANAEWKKALESYEMAIHLNPHYERARLNRAILSDKMENEGKAI